MDLKELGGQELAIKRDQNLEFLDQLKDENHPWHLLWELRVRNLRLSGKSAWADVNAAREIRLLINDIRLNVLTLNDKDIENVCVIEEERIIKNLLRSIDDSFVSNSLRLNGNEMLTYGKTPKEVERQSNALRGISLVARGIIAASLLLGLPYEVKTGVGIQETESNRKFMPLIIGNANNLDDVSHETKGGVIYVKGIRYEPEVITDIKEFIPPIPWYKKWMDFSKVKNIQFANGQKTSVEMANLRGKIKSEENETNNNRSRLKGLINSLMEKVGIIPLIDDPMEIERIVGGMNEWWNGGDKMSYFVNTTEPGIMAILVHSGRISIFGHEIISTPAENYRSNKIKVGDEDAIRFDGKAVRVRYVWKSEVMPREKFLSNVFGNPARPWEAMRMNLNPDGINVPEEYRKGSFKGLLIGYCQEYPGQEELSSGREFYLAQVLEIEEEGFNSGN